MPDASGKPTGRERLVAAFRAPGRPQIVVAVLLALLGFASVTQVRANDNDNTYAGYREQDLIDVLSGLAGTSQRAQSEVARLERTRQDLQDNTRARQAALDQAQKQSDTLGILAGLVPVTGPGIRMTITETNHPISIDSLLDTVEELRTGGAEAMQVNGQVRIIAQSAFEDAVGGVTIDGTTLHSPYVIDVIGDPHTLAGSLTFPRGPIAQLNDDGAQVKVDQLKSLDIQSVRSPEKPKYAQPSPGQ